MMFSFEQWALLLLGAAACTLFGCLFGPTYLKQAQQMIEKVWHAFTAMLSSYKDAGIMLKKPMFSVLDHPYDT